MIGPRHLTEPITVMPHAMVTNSLGDQVAGYGTPISTVGFIEQTKSDESLANRDTTVTTATLILPAGTTVGNLDEITDPAGQTWQVQGDPVHHWNPRVGRESHITATVVTTDNG